MLVIELLMLAGVFAFLLLLVMVWVEADPDKYREPPEVSDDEQADIDLVAVTQRLHHRQRPHPRRVHLPGVPEALEKGE